MVAVGFAVQQQGSGWLGDGGGPFPEPEEYCSSVVDHVIDGEPDNPGEGFCVEGNDDAGDALRNRRILLVISRKGSPNIKGIGTSSSRPSPYSTSSSDSPCAGNAAPNSTTPQPDLLQTPQEGTIMIVLGASLVHLDMAPKATSAAAAVAAAAIRDCMFINTTPGMSCLIEPWARTAPKSLSATVSAIEVTPRRPRGTSRGSVIIMGA
ncbi:hypothetical protein ACTFBT_38460 [Streptomyces microflavus]|uniref:Uncharacterized protein n=1 Tax=Streptomyces microflavus TaxID=1919 RepID=A0A7J0D4S0_STRMI|nr:MULTISPECIES: hypothetical protein [Streptomyces]MDX2982306.1 hypothetical protein [Streptomyces sp. NRRL_B-2249]GFN09716.1 hypothetical protein Smic_82720 [Streptomyces microflavus]GGY00438.1 hypothetical protein GCM10010298_76760 [Streptomyces microflavus]